MTDGNRTERTPTLRDYLRTAWRQRTLIVPVALVVPAVAVAIALLAATTYTAGAKVLLGRDLVAVVTNTQDVTGLQDPARLAQTQAELAQTPTVAAHVLAAPDVQKALADAGDRDLTADDVLGSVSVTPEDNADILDFSYRSSNAALATVIVNEYARQYVAYRTQLDTAAIAKAKTQADQEARDLAARGQSASALYKSLVDKEQQLETYETLQTARAAVTSTASDAARNKAPILRNAAGGLALGLLLGLGIAFLRDALDTRVRSSDDVARHLGLPLLARIGAPARRVRTSGSLPMYADPTGAGAEAYRVLRTNLEFLNIDRRAQSIMITSAVEEEGKSTTIANLAIAFARAGRFTLLVDLDLRRPAIAELFDLPGPGLTDVALGHTDLDRAIRRVEVPGVAGLPTNGTGPTRAELDVLPAGTLPPLPGEFVQGAALGRILDTVRTRYEMILIDAPPMLGVGDSLVLSARADALLVVVRLNAARRPMMVDLRRALGSTPTHKLGFVLTAADADEGYGYGDSAYIQVARPSEVAEKLR